MTRYGPHQQHSIKAPLGLLVAVCVLATGHAASAAPSWKRVGTVTTLSNNQICYSDGTNVICDASAPTMLAGSIGIGSSSPRAALDVNGNAYATTFIGAHSGSGSGLIGLGTSNLSGVTGTANSTTFLRGDNTWSAVVGVTGGFASYIPLWTGTTTIGTSSIYQSGSSIGIGTTTLSQPLTVNGNIDIYGNNNGYLTEMANSALGTTVNKLAKISANNTVTIGTTGDTDGMVGIVVGNAGTGGNAQIAIHGQAGCTFDTAPASVGNWVTISSSSAGACHDTGTKSRSAVSSQTIGLVLGTAAISGSIYPVAVNLNGSGGAIPAGTAAQVQYNSGSSSFAASSSFTYDSTNNALVIGTGEVTPVATTGTVQTTIINIKSQASSFGALGSSSAGITLNTAATGQMAYYSGASAISGTPNLYVAGSNIAIGTTSATYMLSLDGQTSRTIGMQRDYTSSTIGQNLTLQSGGAASGGSNLNGGSLVLQSGISTGTGSSSIQFNTYAGGSTGGSDNSAATAMTITGAGNVGIGTTVPSGTLSIGSNSGTATNRLLNVVAPNSAGGQAGYIGTLGYGVFFGESNSGSAARIAANNSATSANIPLDIEGFGTGLLLNAESGSNVGIGSSSPANALDVNGVIRTSSGIKFADGTTQTTASGGSSQWTTSGSNIYYNTGNVGIGTTSPSYILDVQATSGNARFKSTTGTNRAFAAFNNTGGNAIVGIEASASSLFTSTTPYAAVFGTDSAYPTQFATNNTVRMTIDSSGNVGIGTTGPGYQLDVYGTGNYLRVGTNANSLLMNYNQIQSTGGSLYLNYSQTNATILNANGGNVGIGTTSPATLLEANGNIAASTNGGTTGFVQLWSDNAIIFRSGNSNGGLRFGSATNESAASWSEKMRIADSGNVGIGSSSPANALDVNGTVRVGTAIKFPDGTTQTTAASGGVISGTLCGASQVDSYGQCSSQASCNGVNNCSGCPSGYTRTNVFSYGFNHFSCVKN